MFRSVNDAFDWMVSFTNLEQKPDLSKRCYRLDKMVKLLGIFNDPHKCYKIIHVAGSKGKGSTCSFLGSILENLGFKTGIYSSPHLINYKERITHNHEFFQDNIYIEVIENIRMTLKNYDLSNFPGGEPTTFELMTLAAFLIFEKEKCDWVVLETGLGGRLDSTNVVTPNASVITQIELEHTELLGNTLEEISSEKAGIIKRNVPVFTSNKLEAVVNVLKDFSNKNNSPFYMLPNNFETTINKTGTTLKYQNINYTLGLQGEIQGENALLAIETIKFLFPDIKNTIILSGLEKTAIPGRFQKMDTDPITIIDGAHTKNSIYNTIKTFKTIYSKGTIIFGAITGKDILSMSEIVANNFTDIIISTPGTFKESNILEIQEIFKKLGVNIIKEESNIKAFYIAKSLGKPILVTGSFYMAGAIAKLV